MDAGYGVVVAGDLSDTEVAASPLLAHLRRQGGVKLLDLGRREPGEGPSLSTLAALGVEVCADVILLAEADDLMSQLAARKGVRPLSRQGRIVGLFIRSTNHQYRRRASVMSRARRRWGRGRSGSLDEATFHVRLAKHRSVDAALVLDERYALRHPLTHRWLPDIFCEFEEPLDAAGGETTLWQHRLEEFLETAGDKPVLAYVGANQHRRGYDTLLRLALEEGGVFLHCGRFSLYGEPSDAEVMALRSELGRRGDLFETDGPYVRPQTAAAFLAAARAIVLPYRRHDGSSGVMLQALAAARPVLVPDRGLMAYRARTFGLGRTYRDGDMGDLRRQFRGLLAHGPEPYRPRLDAYLAYFSRAQVAAAVVNAVSGRGEGARLPQLALAAKAIPDDLRSGSR
jgi:glycosyltransferase involved in cell wall biosynthesis